MKSFKVHLVSYSYHRICFSFISIPNITLLHNFICNLIHKRLAFHEEVITVFAVLTRNRQNHEKVMRHKIQPIIFCLLFCGKSSTSRVVLFFTAIQIILKRKEVAERRWTAAEEMCEVPLAPPTLLKVKVYSQSGSLILKAYRPPTSLHRQAGGW